MSAKQEGTSSPIVNCKEILGKKYIEIKVAGQGIVRDFI